MQPYFFPYIGYYQLIKLVDKFILYDDVNYIKGGWINRNKILINGQASLLTIPLSNASPFKKINEIEVIENFNQRQKTLKTIELAYSKAKYFKVVYPLIQEILMYHDKNLVSFLHGSLKVILKYLNINTEISLSSSIKKSTDNFGAAKVIDICHVLGGKSYINAIGGVELYNVDMFMQNGLDLFFLKPDANIQYKQFNNAFVANLSIIDVIMFNDVKTIDTYLNSFELIK